MSTPEENLIFAFWKCLRDDIIGRGCTSDNLSPELRRLPYEDRVIIERVQLQEEAKEFLLTDDFGYWAGLSHFDDDVLRDKFNAIPN